MVDEMKLTKTMCYLLRHKPEDGSLNLDKFGYASINDLAHSLSTMLDTTVNKMDILQVVRDDSKNRYAIKNDCIKCNFGHSVKVELEENNQNTTKIPDFLYHGTSKNSLESIFINGLKPQKRQHVHLTSELSVATQVGKRYAKNDQNLVILTINSEQMIKDGLIVHSTDSSTYLVDYVNPKYILK